MKTDKIIDGLVLKEKLYGELIMAVGNKCKGETRHETALRYIKQAEEGCSDAKLGGK